MKREAIGAIVLTFFSITLPGYGQAQFEQTPQPWAINSLKGMKSLKYGAFDPNNKVIPTVTKAFKGLSIPTKQIDPKTDDKNKIGVDEGRMVVFVANRDNDHAWVGLAVRQLVQMQRNPTVKFATETYRNGALVPKAETDSEIKKLCAAFVADLNKANGK